jgi:hypothetical protein
LSGQFALRQLVSSARGRCVEDRIIGASALSAADPVVRSVAENRESGTWLPTDQHSRKSASLVVMRASRPTVFRHYRLSILIVCAIRTNEPTNI